MSPEELRLSIDTLWVLIAAILVIFMQVGFGLVEAGLTRSKSVANIMMKNLMDFSLGSLAYWAVGFAVAFGAGNAFLGGEGFFLSTSQDYGIPTPVFFLFQMAFAATAATIVSGAMAERTRFRSYILYSVVITAFIYPVVSHWVWGGGWLAERGFVDFAGSTVVHSTGGWAALVGAMYLGPRLGKYTSDGRPRAIPGHSIPFAVLGTLILWIGWFGFNAGSQLAADPVAIAHIATTTTLAAAAGAAAAMATIWLVSGKPDVAMTANGALAGLVGITAGTANVEPWASVAIGSFAGLIVVGSVILFDRVRVDDPVGAISVHGTCGAFGTLAVGIFATDRLGEAGLLYGGGVDLLATQALGVAAVAAWVLGTSAIMFGAIRAVAGLRVPEEEELEGLDIVEHGVPGYGEVLLGGGTPVPGAAPAPSPGSARVPALQPAPDRA